MSNPSFLSSVLVCVSPLFEFSLVRESSLFLFPFFCPWRFALFFSYMMDSDVRIRGVNLPAFFSNFTVAVVGNRLTVRGDILSLRLIFLFLNNQVTRC